MPGTLYSAGMHFFQIKESMEKGQKITIQKELGKQRLQLVSESSQMDLFTGLG